MDPDPYPYFQLFNQISCAVAIPQELVSVNVPTVGVWVAVVLALACLMMSAFVSGSETAYFSLTASDIESLDPENRAGVERVIAKPQQLLASILIANNLVNVSIVVLCNYVMTEVFVFHSVALDFVIKTVVMTFLILLFGEILPKLYSNNHRLRWAVFAIGGITLVYKIFSPLAKLMVLSTSLVNRVVTKKSDELSLDDLSHALEITDVNEAKDKNILQEILKFGGKTVSDIMTPRVDITDINWDCPFSKLLDTIRETGYSRLPVYIDSEDNIKGIIYAKDLLPYVGKMDDTFKWQALLRSSFFVPETRMIDDILEDFRKKKIHMAIVVDEYGGTQGLVTLEDVLEEIVGEINDEYDDEEQYYKRLSSDTFIFEGKTLLNDFYRVTGLDEEEFEDVADDAETIAGLLLNVKHDFPKEKELITYGRCRFLIDKADKHRIDSVKVRIMPESETEGKGSNSHEA